MTLNEYAKECHTANAKWWVNIDTGEPLNRNKKELLMLIISELAEAMEGERKNLMDDKLPHRKMAEVEMADAFIRICDFSAGFKVQLREYYGEEQLRVQNKAEMIFQITAVIAKIDTDNCTAESLSRLLSEAISMIRGYCKRFGYDLEGAYAEKMAYNATRIDHTHEARRIAGGKQF